MQERNLCLHIVSQHGEYTAHIYILYGTYTTWRNNQLGEFVIYIYIFKYDLQLHS